MASKEWNAWHNVASGLGDLPIRRNFAKPSCDGKVKEEIKKGSLEAKAP
jgi:hypothetical protein